MPAWHAAVHAITAAVGQEAAGRTGSGPPAESSCRQPRSQTCMGGGCDVIVLLMIKFTQFCFFYGMGGDYLC